MNKFRMFREEPAYFDRSFLAPPPGTPPNLSEGEFLCIKRGEAEVVKTPKKKGLLMRPEFASLISTFETELEKLGGKCYVASSANEIADRILNIASQNNCVNIVKQRVDIDNEEAIDRLLSHRFTVLGLEEIADPISILNKADLAVTRVDMLIAETGTAVISTRADVIKLASCLPRIQIGIVLGDNIVRTHRDAAAYLRKQFELSGSVSFISGPSRTADIEMKLILGVHGPHQVHVIILKQ